VTYTATIYADAPDAGRNPEAYLIGKRAVTARDTIRIEMAERGGQAITFIPAEK